MVNSLLSDDEQAIIDMAYKRLADSYAPPSMVKSSMADVLAVLRDLHQRARVAVRDERYKWRNLMVDVMEGVVNDELTPENALRRIYERLAEEQEND